MENKTEQKEISAFDKLKPRQKLFVIEYLKDFNGTQAAIRSKYSKKTAQVIASENLSKPLIKAAFKEKINEILEDKEELVLKVRRELECLSFSDIKDHIDFDNKLQYKTTNKTDTRAIESVKVKRSYKTVKGADEKDESFTVEDIEFKMHNKNVSLNSLKQMLGIAEKLELSGKGGELTGTVINIIGVVPQQEIEDK
jgi:phage terminase small subunit